MGLFDTFVNTIVGGGSSSNTPAASSAPASKASGGFGALLSSAIGGGGNTATPKPEANQNVGTDAVSTVGETVSSSDTRGRGNRSYLREAVQDRQNAQNQTVTWDNFQSKLQQALNQYNGYFDVFQNTFGERQDLTDDDRRRMNLAGISTLNNGEFGNGLEDWKTYGEGQERQIKAQTADLRKFLDDNADRLNQDAAKEVREQLDLMDNYSGQLWKAAYNDEGLRARDAYKRTGNAYTVAEKAYNEAQAKLKDVIQNTPSDVDYDKAVESARQEAKAAEEALRLARNAYEEAGGLGHSYSNEDRVSDTIKGAVQNSAASSVDAFRALWEKGEGQRLANDQPRIAQLDLAARTAQTEYFRARAAAGGNEDDPAVKAAKQKYEEARDFANRYRGIVEGDQGLAEKAATKADDILSRSQLDIARAKEGASGLTKGLVDVGVAGTQLATDAAISAMTGIPSLALVGIRSFGGGTQQARLGGGNIDQQLAYGAANAAVEMMTEKMADGLAGMFGKGYADDVAEEVIGKLAQSDAGRTALRTIYGMMGEGAEEFVSSAIDPALRSIYNGKSAKENYSEEEISDWLYDALIGAALGAPGAGISIVNGQNAQKNAALRTADNVRMSGLGSVANQTDAAWNVLSGRYSPEQQANIERYAQNQLGIENPATQYTSGQQVTPEEQAARQTVRTILESGRVNNTSANQILNDPALRAAAEYQTGLSFEGMTTEEARTALQRAARSGAYTTAQFNAQTERAATADNARAQTALEEEAVRNNASNYDSYIRGILRTGADTQTANEILNDPTLKEVWERMTGKTLPENRKSAVKMLQQTTRSNVGINVDSAIEQYIAERTAPPQAAENTPQAQDVSADEITQPATQTEAAGESQELNFNPAPAAEAAAAETVMTPDAETPAETATTTTPAQAPAPAAQTSSAETQTTDERGYTGPRVHTQDRVFETNLTEEERAMEGLTEEEARHIRHSDEEVDRRAKARLENREQARAELLDAESWTDEDVATAGYLIQAEMAVADSAKSEAERTAAYKRLAELKKQWNKQGTEEGRALRQRRRFVAEEAVSEAANLLYTERGENEKQLRKLTPQGKDNIMRQVRALANQYNNLPAGDSTALINLIKEMSNVRKTTGLGTTRAMSKNIDYALNQVAQKEGGMDFLREVAATQIKSVASDYLDPGIINKLSAWRFMSMLSNAATPVANLGSNFIFGSFMESMTSNFAAPVDMLMSLYTGRRTVATEANAVSPTKWKGSWDGFLRSFIEVTLDAETEQSSYGYNEIKGRTFKMTGNPIERMLSLMERNQGYLLKSTDQAAKGGTEAVIRKGLGRLGTDAESIDALATDAAKYRTLQQESKIANTTAKVRNAIDEAVHIGNERTGKYGLATDIMPFAQVPANAVKVTLEAQPAIATTRAVLNTVRAIGTMVRGGEISATEQANISRSWGRLANSAAVVAAFMAMAARGHLRNYDDDDRDVAAQNRYEGKNGTQLNISSLFRDITGGDRFEHEDDTWIDFSWVPMLNALANFSADVYDSYADGDRGKDLLLDGVNASWNSMVDSFLEFPAVSKISDMIDTYKNSEAETGWGKAIETGVTGVSQTASGILIPNAVRSVAAGIDPVERDTTMTDGYMETIGRNLVGGIPFARQTLPEKLDNFGNPVVNNGGLLNFLDRTLIPGNVSKHNKQSEASRLIGDLIEQTGDTSLMPERFPPKSMEIGGEKTKLTAEERRAFKRDYGSTIADLLEGLAKDRSFQNSTPEEQKEVIKKVESYAKDRAKAAATEAHGADYTSDYQTLLDGVDKPGLPNDVRKLDEKNMGEYLSFTTRLNDAQKNGDYAAMDQLLADYGKLSGNTKGVLDDKGTKDLKNLLAFKNAGSSSESFYKLKDAIGEEQWNLDASSAQGGHVRLAGLGSADIPDAEKDKLVASGAYGLSKTATNVYQILRQYGLSPKDASAWFENADWYARNGEKDPKADGTLNAYEVAVGISKIPGLSNDQRNAMYKDFKAAIQRPGDPYDTWKKRSYTVALGVSTNYGRTTGKSDDMNITGSGGSTATTEAQPGTPTIEQMYDSYNNLLRSMGLR